MSLNPMKWLGLLKEFKQINFTEEWYPCYCIHQLWLIIFSQTTYNLYSAENKVRRLKLRKKKQHEIIKKKTSCQNQCLYEVISKFYHTCISEQRYQKHDLCFISESHSNSAKVIFLNFQVKILALQCFWWTWHTVRKPFNVFGKRKSYTVQLVKEVLQISTW